MMAVAAAITRRGRQPIGNGGVLLSPVRTYSSASGTAGTPQSMDNPKRTANIIIGTNGSMGAGSMLTSPNQPYWKIAVTTPYAAPIERGSSPPP